MSASGATLTASFAGIDTNHLPQGAGFIYGTSASALIDTAYYNDGILSTSGSFSVAAGALNPNTTYYAKAFITAYVGSTYVDVLSSNTLSFTTSAATWSLTAAERGCLEMPVVTGQENYVGTFYGSTTHTAANRNYSYNYSYRYLGCLWVAYPLAPGHITGSYSSSGWADNSNVPAQYQVRNMYSNSYPSNFSDGADYTKGHQIPNADRKNTSLMNEQTYYMTNQTPQLGNKFNGSQWGGLEAAVRTQVTSFNDTIYVVTGACYRKAGGTETVKVLHANSNSSVTPKEVPVPNYYWKVLLKVRRTNGVVTSASAIGFWFPHQDLTGTTYSSYAKSVSTIESYTGISFFANLPSGLVSGAKSNSNWNTFCSF
ncbi:MAG: DNA/RNA non-specific endonuclease [Bacteroidales bacterium]|nr:DNA/RNA non-specific endonuclease [Bacteroidales bacterium]